MTGSAETAAIRAAVLNDYTAFGRIRALLSQLAGVPKPPDFYHYRAPSGYIPHSAIAHTFYAHVGMSRSMGEHYADLIAQQVYAATIRSGVSTSDRAQVMEVVGELMHEGLDHWTAI